MTVRQVAALLGGGQQKLDLGKQPSQVPALLKSKADLSPKGKKTFNSLKKKFDSNTLSNMITNNSSDGSKKPVGNINEPRLKKKQKDKVQIKPNVSKKIGKLDTAYNTSISEDQQQTMRRGDGAADVLAKIINFMKRSRAEMIKKREILEDFREEKEAKEKREQEELFRQFGVKSVQDQKSGTLEKTGTPLEKVSNIGQMERPETAERIKSQQSIPPQRRKKSDGSVASGLIEKVGNIITDVAATVGKISVAGAAAIGTSAVAGNKSAPSGSTGGTDLASRVPKSDNKLLNAGLVTKIPKPDGTVEIREGGDIAWRNNNPGNIIWSDFAKSQGAIGAAGSFAGGKYQYAVFPTREMGEKAREVLLLSGKSRYYTAKTTISEAMRLYGGDTSGNYAAYVSKAMGVTPQTTIGQLNNKQKQEWMEAISRFERNIPGKVSVVKEDGKTVPAQKTSSIPSQTSNDGSTLDKKSKENRDIKKVEVSSTPIVISNNNVLVNNRIQKNISIFEPNGVPDLPLAVVYSNAAVPFIGA